MDQRPAPAAVVGHVLHLRDGVAAGRAPPQVVAGVQRRIQPHPAHLVQKVPAGRGVQHRHVVQRVGGVQRLFALQPVEHPVAVGGGHRLGHVRDLQLERVVAGGQRQPEHVFGVVGLDAVAEHPAGAVAAEAGAVFHHHRHVHPVVGGGGAHGRAVADGVHLPHPQQLAVVGAGGIQALNGAAGVVHGHRLDDHLEVRPGLARLAQDLLLEVARSACAARSPSAGRLALDQSTAGGDGQAGLGGEARLAVAAGAGPAGHDVRQQRDVAPQAVERGARQPLHPLEEVLGVGRSTDTARRSRCPARPRTPGPRRR